MLIRNLILVFTMAALTGACSVKKFAANTFGNAISGGSSVYLSDNDPELVKEAIPFGLKTYESLLEVTPEHRGLLLSAASGFISYAYLLQNEADEIDYDDFRAAQKLRSRASNLYLRGRDYAFRGLSIKNPDFLGRFMAGSDGVLLLVEEKDIAYLYWAAAGWAAALSTAKDDTDLIASLPFAGQMMERVIELDEAFNDGAAWQFMVSYEGSRPNGELSKAREYYERARSFSGNTNASLYIALAEAVSIPEQNLAEFRRLIDAAKAVDVDAKPSIRLINILAQRRAEMLEDRVEDLFLISE